ncbi:LysR family transcriptional regulator [Aestuariivita boseongensis]|uniref:LysR family transcriptional regulator n=1 Tax=Aestuariivita boseongensis TaxID=1470562 RepID=UPI00067FFA34|nr:LysR family transcriptional regulator [Aestuariivita boseongensis]
MRDLHALRLFLSVARDASFAEAARRMGTTPASVTRAIAALEEELGTQLFVRTTRKVSLTSEGAAFAARIGHLVTDLDEAMDSLRHRDATAHGDLRLSVPVSFGLRVLPDILQRFRLSHPQVRLSVDMTDRFVDILDGSVDLAVRISGPPEDRSTIWRKICGVERLLVGAPEVPEAAIRSPDDLRAERCLSYGSDPAGEKWSLSHGRERRSLRAGRGFSSNNGDLLAQMAEQGAGVALLPRFIVATGLEAGRLVHVLPDWRPDPLWLTLYYPPYTKLPPPVAAFSAFFEEEILKGGFSA